MKYFIFMLWLLGMKWTSDLMGSLLRLFLQKHLRSTGESLLGIHCGHVFRNSTCGHHGQRLLWQVKGHFWWDIRWGPCWGLGIYVPNEFCFFSNKISFPIHVNPQWTAPATTVKFLGIDSVHCSSCCLDNNFKNRAFRHIKDSYSQAKSESCLYHLLHVWFCQKI